MTLYFSAIETSAGTDASSLFENFTTSAVLAAYQDELSVDFVVADAFTGSASVKFAVSAAGHTISGGSQTIKLTEYYYVSLAVVDSESNSVVLGDSFNVVASVDNPVASALTITLSSEDEAISGLPTTLTIAAGEKVAVSEELTVSATAESGATLTINGSASNSHYSVNALSIVTTGQTKGSYLNDETWVYDDPGQVFYSTNTQSLLSEDVLANGVHMTK